MSQSTIVRGVLEEAAARRCLPQIQDKIEDLRADVRVVQGTPLHRVKESLMWIVNLALRMPYTFVVMAVLIVRLGMGAIRQTSTDIFRRSTSRS